MNRRNLFRSLLGIPIVSKFTKKVSLEEIAKLYHDCMFPKSQENEILKKRCPEFVKRLENLG